MKPDKIFHISEEGNIEIFIPRPSPSYFEDLKSDVVFGISEKLLHNYLLPRDCPRVTYYASEKTLESDKQIFFRSAAEYVIAIEAKWLPIIQQTTIYRYELPPETFSLLDECAGYYISKKQVYPISVLRIDDPVRSILSGGNIELLILPSLLELTVKVSKSTLNFSLIRMRNAIS